MTDHLYLDIETIPAQRPDILDGIMDSKFAELDATVAAIRPPGNIKKLESIEAWMKDEAPAKAIALTETAKEEAEAAYRKTSLDGAFGQICVIGFALDDSAPHRVWCPDWANPNTERELLEDFYCALTDLIPANRERSMCVVGHNVAGFDLRFMVQRSIVNGVRPHRVIASAAQAKPWESDKVFDTMIQWAGIGNRVKLDKLCKALSIPTPKDGIDGSKVWDFVKAGKIDEVAAYCARDVEATRAVHRRLTFQVAPQPAFDFEDIPV
jgi:hypothetical protein